ncbi:MAG: hypothetical protein IT423_02920, partial [Pirellulaceae bacterium]|nr:hypothetical protein [Pirellulaceae bacterium]
ALLHRYLTDLFGVGPELLADDPQQAFEQYNGQLLSTNVSSHNSQLDPLQVPLLAHDPGLNDLGLALLDCPDIQTAFTLEPGDIHGLRSPLAQAPLRQDAEQVQQHRRQMLGRVGRLCSAFLVVSKLSSLHDSTLLSIFETLRDTMPGVRRILAVNKVKARYAPSVVDEQAQSLVDQFQITDVYMAYDFRSHWAEYRLPPAPQGLRCDASDPLPIFFRADLEVTASSTLVSPTRSPTRSPDRTQASSTANKIADDDGPGDRVAGDAGPDAKVAGGMRPPRVKCYLQDLSQLLAPGRLVIESRRSVLNQLQKKSGETLAWLQGNIVEREKQMHDAWLAVAEACYAFMAQRDANDQTVGLRLQTSPAIVAQMSDSLVRAAPWSMRPSLAIDRSVRQLQSSIVGGVRRVRWLQNVSSSVSQFLGSFRQGQTGKVVTADRFRMQLERTDYSGVLARWATEALTAACEQSLARFQHEDTVRLDQTWLDRWSDQVWQHMSLKRKLYVGMMPLAPIFGPLLAVTLIPFDGGGTAVLVFATTKELLLAAGIAAVALPTTAGGELQDIVESEAALSQLSELFAVTCDSLGLPRPATEHMPRIKLGGIERELAVSQLAVKSPATVNALNRWRLATNFAKNLQQTLANLQIEMERSDPINPESNESTCS